jgi:hypothetical protein
MAHKTGEMGGDAACRMIGLNPSWASPRWLNATAKAAAKATGTGVRTAIFARITHPATAQLGVKAAARATMTGVKTVNSAVVATVVNATTAKTVAVATVIGATTAKAVNTASAKPVAALTTTTTNRVAV